MQYTMRISPLILSVQSFQLAVFEPASDFAAPAKKERGDDDSVIVVSNSEGGELAKLDAVVNGALYCKVFEGASFENYSSDSESSSSYAGSADKLEEVVCSHESRNSKREYLPV